MFGQTWANNQKFNPKWVSGLVLWLDANDPAANGTQPSNGSSLSSWTDKSGIGNSGSQGTGANQPVFNTNQINGHPGITFTATKWFNIGQTSFSTGSTGRTWFGVMRPTDVSFGYMLYYGTNARDQVWAPTINGSFLYIDNSTDGAMSSTTTLVNNTNYVFEQRYPGGGTVNTQLLTVNGVSQAVTYFGGGNSINTGSAVTPTVGATGGANGLIGIMGEVLFYNKSLSATEEKDVKIYLANKWGISVS